MITTMQPPTTLGPVYVMYEVVDLDQIEQFLCDFGLRVVKRTATDVWMAAADGYPYAYHACLGSENRFLGAGFAMSNRDALEQLAALDGQGRQIESIAAPGGGWRLRMHMPDGFWIDAVCGLETVADTALPPGQAPLNFLETKARVNRSVRVTPGPKPVRRLGHFVLHVSDHARSVQWLTARFGLMPSDYFGTDDETPHIFGTFLRVNAGARLVDHHCLLVLQSERIGAHHVSFEMTGLDDLMSSHDYLIERGYRLDVGVGRHMLGSQIFDYWRDPFGFRIEHYTDGDVVNDAFVPSVFSGSAEDTTQWGARPNAEFFA